MNSFVNMIARDHFGRWQVIQASSTAALILTRHRRLPLVAARPGNNKSTGAQAEPPDLPFTGGQLVQPPWQLVEESPYDLRSGQPFRFVCQNAGTKAGLPMICCIPYTLPVAFITARTLIDQTERNAKDSLLALNPVNS